MVDTNKKLPKHAWDDNEIVPKKGFITGEQDILGGKFFKYASPSEPDKFSTQKTSPTGSYETVQIDSSKKEIRTNLNVGETRGYTSGGRSNQIDGHDDKNSESTIRQNSAGDYGRSCKTHYAVATDQKIETVRHSYKFFTVSPGETQSFNGSYGDQVNEHSGNWHEGFKKDHVQAVTGNKITMIEGGDYAIHVQKGNYDTHIGARGRIFSTGNMLIESTTLITLKVGASTIVIGPSNITMISPRIDLNP